MVQREIQAANVELLNIKIMIEETKGYTLSIDTYKKAKALKMKDHRYHTAFVVHVKNLRLNLTT